MLDLARNNPNYNVIIKTRLYGNEITVHKDQYPYVELLKNKRNIPSNFSLYNDSIESAFSEMDACISLSSSAALEAVYYGIPTYIIKDLGISERFYNPPFLQSGLFITFEELGKLTQFLQCVNENWFEKQIWFNPNRNAILNEIVEDLISKPRLSLNLQKNYIISSKRKFYPKLKKLFRSPKLFFLDSRLLKKLKSRRDKNKFN